MNPRVPGKPVQVIAIIVMALAGFIFLLTGINPTTLLPSTEDGGTPGVVQSTPEKGAPETWWEVYFTDPPQVNNPDQWQGSIEEVLISHIAQAEFSIDIAAFEFNLTPVAEALLAAHQRGVTIRWITDDEHGIGADEEEGRGQFALLQKAGIEVKDAYFTKDSFDDFRNDLTDQAQARFRARIDQFGKDQMLFLERYILLHVIDAKWKDHLRAVDELREGIHLRAYGQRNPLVEYKQESFEMFEQMVASIKEEAVEFLFKVQAVRKESMPEAAPPSQQQFLHPDATGMGTRAPEPEPGPGGSSIFGATPQVGRPSGGAGRQPETVKRDERKVGRNEPCPCGSGKKFKKCHGA